MDTAIKRQNTRSSLSALTMSTLYLPFYDALCAKLPEEWAPCSGIRSFMSQDSLYAQGREQVDGLWIVKDPGKVVTNAKGGQSAHNYALATDWCLWTPDGEPHWPDRGDHDWQAYVGAVRAVGLMAGADFSRPDVDHNELKINVPWSTIGTVFFDKGPEAAKAAIQAAMSPVTI